MIKFEINITLDRASENNLRIDEFKVGSYKIFIEIDTFSKIDF